MEGITDEGSQALPDDLTLQGVLELRQPGRRVFQHATYIRYTRVYACNDGGDIGAGRDGPHVVIAHAETEWQRVIDQLLFGKLVIDLVADHPHQVVHIQERTDDLHSHFT